MKIRDLLAAESIELNGKVTGKKETLDAMVDLMAKSGKINDVEVYRKGVYAREEESTTGIGEGIAIPHCKSDSVSRPGLAAMVVPEGVDFDSLDGEKVNLIFLIAAPNTKENVHLDVLSKLSVLLMDEDFTANLRNAKTIDEVEAMEPIKIDQVVIGSCTNGRMEDLRKAAAILKGHTVHPDVRVMVIPATQKIYKECIKEGLLDIFVDAGCAVNTPSCGPCMGGHMGVMAAGEKCVSTTNRNFVGRMGHVDSLIYLASPEVAAASAIAGCIANPEKVGEK